MGPVTLQGGDSGFASPPLLHLALIFTTVQKGSPLQAFPGVFFKTSQASLPSQLVQLLSSPPSGGSRCPPHCCLSPPDPAPPTSSPSMPDSTETALPEASWVGQCAWYCRDPKHSVFPRVTFYTRLSHVPAVKVPALGSCQFSLRYLPV